MKIKITGLVYATVEPVEEIILIDFSKNLEMDLKHTGEMSVITINEKQYYLETSSLQYEIVNQ